MKNHSTLGAYFGLFLMTSIIGLSFMFVKIGLQYSSAIDLLAHRFSVALLLALLLLALRVIKLPRLNKQKIKTLVLLSLFFPILFFLFQAYGIQYCTSSEAGITFAMSPIVTLIVAQVVLKERTTILQKIGIFLSVLGILYIIFSNNQLSNSTDIRGFSLLFIAILSFTTYLVFGKKLGSQFKPIEITVWIILIACIFFNIWSVSSHLYAGTLEQFLMPFSESSFTWSVLYLGILSSIVTSFLTNYALPIIPASQIAVFNNLSPILAILGGVVFLDEKLYSYHIIGGSLVFIGIALTLIFKSKPQAGK